jgi:hypothetical protein
MSSLPRHIQQRLIDTGTVTEDRVTNRPTLRRCKRCRAQTLTAIADDGPQAPGIRVDLDPHLLTTLGELQAITHGIATYADTGAGLTWRDPISIRRTPADARRVHHLHRCTPPPVHYRPTPRATTVHTADPTVAPY